MGDGVSAAAADRAGTAVSSVSVWSGRVGTGFSLLHGGDHRNRTDNTTAAMENSNSLDNSIYSPIRMRLELAKDLGKTDFFLWAFT